MDNKVKREWKRVVQKLVPAKLNREFRRARRKIGLPSLGELRRRFRGEVSVNAVVSQQVYDLVHEKIETLEQRIETQSESIRWLVENQKWILQNQSRGTASSDFSDSGPLVSIVLPVWNREKYIADAIQSVIDQSYSNWELLIVDDGSTDGTLSAISTFLKDPRVTLLRKQHRGVCVARNAALSVAQGEIVAYLDSDNQWVESNLQAVVETFTNDPKCQSVYSAQLVENDDQNWCYIRDFKYQRDEYLSNGGIDLNAFAHRRELYEKFGGFDESLDRLVDWDLIARYTEDVPPSRIATVGCRYREMGIHRISTNGNFWRNRHLIQRKWQKPEVDNLKVLYVVRDYPQLSESYVRWEIDCMRRWGVEVHVWSSLEKTISPYPSDVPHHNGLLEEAMLEVKPSIVHFHWLNIASMFLEVVSRYGAVATVRGHGFEYSSEQTAFLLRHPTVQRIFAFPHFAKPFDHLAKIQSSPCAFNSELYHPDDVKDPALVVRTGSAKKTKGIQDFIDTAVLCPGHQFVLIISRLNGLETYPEEVIAYNEAKGSPVRIHVNMPHEEVAEIIREAGIYMHTYGAEEPFGMPISIAEAMATGCYTLVRNLPGAGEYLGPGGDLYSSVTEAVSLIKATETWYQEDWSERQRKTVDYAYSRFTDLDVYRPMLDCWKNIIANGVDPATIIDEILDPELQPVISLILEDNRADQVDVFSRPLLTHLLGTYKILKGWGLEKDVCYAGLVHSLYTAVGQHRLEVSDENRERMKSIIGEDSEKLAYLFQTSFRKIFDNMVKAGSDFSFVGRFSEERVQLSQAEFEALCTIHLAEWLEKRKRLPGDSHAQEVYSLLAHHLGGIPLAHYQREVCPELQTLEQQKHPKFEKAAA